MLISGRNNNPRQVKITNFTFEIKGFKVEKENTLGWTKMLSMYNNRRLWEEANFRLNYLTERQTNREMWIEQLNAWMSFLDILTNVFFLFC